MSRGCTLIEWAFSVLIFTGVLGCDSQDNSGEAANTDGPMAIWKAPDQAPASYCRAGHALLAGLVDKGEWLSVGRVAEVLGWPSAAESECYAFDFSGNVLKDLPRLSLRYETKGVIVIFSVEGLALGVLYEGDNHEEKGLGFWQTTFPRAQEWPMLVGARCALQEKVQLLSAVHDLEATHTQEGEWYRRIMGVKHAGGAIAEKYRGPCTARAKVIDVIRPDFVRAGYSITGSHLLWHDTWWVLRGEGWEHLVEEQALSLFSPGEGLAGR